MSKPFMNETAPAVRHMTESELVRFALADDYELIEELGRGGMAIVFRAREKALDREVAIKVLPARLVMDEGFVERFEHEARTAAKLEHPNIVPIYRVGRAGPNNDVIYFVMKLLRGQSLSSVMAERGKLDPSDVRRILMETASALHYAARQSVVHRDIKPDNIMLDSEGRCVLTDFGIAKAPGGQQTTAGTSMGTPRYMSPEHATGQKLDGRSDMYSLGVVAYQCLFGKPPFEADEPFAVLYKHIHEPLPEPTLETDEMRQLYSVVSRMLAKKPDDRFQDGNELIAALGGQTSDPSLVASILTSPGLMAPTEVMPTPKPWSLSRWRMLSRTRQLVWSAVILLVAATSLGMMLGLPADNESPTLDSSSTALSARVGGTTTSPPTVGGALVKAEPPKPSERAAFILLYNTYASNCPKQVDTTVTAKRIPYALLVDSIGDRPRGESMSVRYDVCGLAANTPFASRFTLTKLNQRSILGMGKQDPVTVSGPPNSVNSPRSKERFDFDISKMSAGDYRLDVIVTDSKNRELQASRQFRITDK